MLTHRNHRKRTQRNWLTLLLIWNGVALLQAVPMFPLEGGRTLRPRCFSGPLFSEAPKVKMTSSSSAKNLLGSESPVVKKRGSSCQDLLLNFLICGAINWDHKQKHLPPLPSSPTETESKKTSLPSLREALVTDEGEESQDLKAALKRSASMRLKLAALIERFFFNFHRISRIRRSQLAQKERSIKVPQSNEMKAEKNNSIIRDDSSVEDEMDEDEMTEDDGTSIKSCSPIRYLVEGKNPRDIQQKIGTSRLQHSSSTDVAPLDFAFHKNVENKIGEKTLGIQEYYSPDSPRQTGDKKSVDPSIS